MSGLIPLSDQQWAAFLDAAGASLTRWGFQPRPVGIRVLTDELAHALCAEGRGSLVVYRNGRLDYSSHWLENA